MKHIKHNEELTDSDFELQRLYDWLTTESREPAQTKFTAGWTRNVAREIEFLLKIKEEFICTKCYLRQDPPKPTEPPF